jgi:uncharacterized protein YdiU (UPF0061 family)
MWIGSGGHYSFMNQIHASEKNLKSLGDALVVLFDDDPFTSREEVSQVNTLKMARLEIARILSEFSSLGKIRLSEVFAAKLGLGPLPKPPHFQCVDPKVRNFVSVDEVQLSRYPARVFADGLWRDLEDLMKRSSVDWTMFWRELAYSAQDCSIASDGIITAQCVDNALQRISKSIIVSSDVVVPVTDRLVNYGTRASNGECEFNPGEMLDLCPWSCRAVSIARDRSVGVHQDHNSKFPFGTVEEWTIWLHRWFTMKPNSRIMLRASPKYIPREWMLVRAYESAAEDVSTSISRFDGQENAPSELFGEIRRLQELFSHPYDEQSPEMQKRYYRLPPTNSELIGGMGFMS